MISHEPSRPLELDALLRRSLEVAAGVALGDGAALVIRLLALGDANLELRHPVADVELERHEREPLRLGAPDQLGDLVAMEEQLARPSRLVVVPVSLLVWRDMRPDQPCLPLLDPGVRLGQVDTPGTDRLDLCSGERDAGLERLLDGELVAGAAVDGDGLIGHWNLAHRWE